MINSKDFPDIPARLSPRSDRRFFLAAAILFLLLLGPVFPLLQLTINNVPKVYLPADAPAVVIDDEIRRYFPNDQGMAFLFEGPDLYSDRFLLLLDELTDTLQAHPDIQRVYSVTLQDHIQGSADGFLIEPLLNARKLDRLSVSDRRQRASSDRFARGILVATDGSALALVVIPRTLDDSFMRIALQSELHALLDAQGLADAVVAEAGLITTDVEQTREFLLQLAWFIPLTVLIGLALVWLLFRRLLAVVLGLLTIGATVGPAIALYTVFELPFNLISSILPPLLCALTIAALVHLFTGLRLAARRGFSGRARVDAALEHIRRPGLYSALTTMSGFGALGLSEIRPISHLGLVAACGVGLIYLVVFHLLPPLIVHLDRASWDSANRRRSLPDMVIRKLFHTGTRYPVVTLLVALVVFGACTPVLGRIVVETNLLEFFAEGHRTRVATERFEAKLSGTGSLDILIESDSPEGLAAPEALAQIRGLALWAESQAEVDRATSIVTYVEEMHAAFNGGSDAYRVVPDDAFLIGQYLFVYDGTDLYDFIDPDLQIGRLHLNLNVHGARAIDDLLERISTRLDAQQQPGLSFRVAGLGRMFADQVDLLISGQLRSILGAIAIIFLLMLVEWRSLRDSLVCLLPNLAPVLLIFILMGVFGIWLDVATAMITSVAVGIAIDDTIHIFHGFIERVRRGVSPVAAIARTYHHAGRAVMTTTIILCAQFLVLLISDFVPIRHFGLLASTGMLAALFFDLLLLPAILILVYHRRPPVRPALTQPATQPAVSPR
jgi:predicted RND superfamily exporter protein